MFSVQIGPFTPNQDSIIARMKKSLSSKSKCFRHRYIIVLITVISPIELLDNTYRSLIRSCLSYSKKCCLDL